MNPAVLQNPFVQTALPIMFTILIAVLVNNKAFDAINKRLDDLRADMNRQFVDVTSRLDRIEAKFDDHERRIIKLEAETSLVKSR